MIAQCCNHTPDTCETCRGSYLWSFIFFFFNDTATTEIYTLSLHDALPISMAAPDARQPHAPPRVSGRSPSHKRDRKSTRLNSSHLVISYAVFCLKKKKKHHASKDPRYSISAIAQTP